MRDKVQAFLGGTIFGWAGASAFGVTNEFFLLVTSVSIGLLGFAIQSK